MLTLDCSSTRREDGSWLLCSESPRQERTRASIVLSGAWASIWEQLTQLATLPDNTQRSALAAIPGRARARVLAVIGQLEASGFLHVNNDVAPAESAPAAQWPLRKLHFEVTYRCNYRCRSCYLGSRLDRPDQWREDADTFEWVKVARSAGALGCSSVTITGGEPFLRKDLPDIVAALNDAGIVADINTNASCITDAIAKRLRELVISSVAVTLYGSNGESSESYTNTRRSFDLTLRGIQHLLDHEVPVMVKYFAAGGTGEGYDAVARRLSPLRVTPIAEIVHGDVFEGVSSESTITGGATPRTEAVQPEALPCRPGGTCLAISPDGHIRPCPRLVVWLGNAFQDGLEYVWRASATLPEFRSFWTRYCHANGYDRGGARSRSGTRPGGRTPRCWGACLHLGG